MPVSEGVALLLLMVGTPNAIHLSGILKKQRVLLGWQSEQFRPFVQIEQNHATARPLLLSICALDMSDREIGLLSYLWAGFPSRFWESFCNRIYIAYLYLNCGF